MYRKIWNIFLCLMTMISPYLNTIVYYFASHKKIINLAKPRGFNEKVLWLKLNTYSRSPLVKKCADKYAVREFITEKGYGDCLVPLLACYEQVDDIKWEELPEKFALKINFGSGYNIICKDKSKLDIEDCRKRLNKWIKSKYYLSHSELQYKDVKPYILVEKFIENQNGEFPADFKFYCFDGEPKCLLYCSERIGSHAKKTLFDLNGNVLNWRNDITTQPFPETSCFEDMLEICRALSKGFPFVRVDLYDHNGKVLFGELTFTPAGGTGKYNEEGSRILGSWINL